MSNASSSQGQLQRSGVQRLITDRKGRTREGGPGSGRHKGTGMNNQEFSEFAKKVGTARNANRDKEDKLRNAGNHEEANKIYAANKAAVGKLLSDANIHPKDFDDHMKQYAKAAGSRPPNVKMSNMFPNWDSGQRESRRFRASRIRESYSAAFAERGQNEQQKTQGSKALKGRVYLVTIIEEGLGNSKDKNFYSGDALKNGVQVFNGAKAFCDHPDAISEKTLPERSMRALVGWYSDCFTDSNPTTGKVRLRGKLHFFPDAKWLTDKIDTILTDPSAKNLFGISINAIGKTRPAQMGGEEVNYVEEFQRVDSADVVTEPAARGGFDAMLESRRGKVTSGRMKRTRESGILSPEKAKEVGDSLVSACNSDSPDELKQAAFEASKVLHAASSISGRGPGQANEEQYSNINPSGGSDSMNRQKVKASSGSGGLRFRKKKALRAAAGKGADNEDLGEPEPSDIEPRLEEADVEDEEGRGELGDQQEFGGGKKYRTVKASRHHRAVPAHHAHEAFEDEAMEGFEDEGLEDEGLEDEDGMAGMGGGMGPGAAAPGPQGAPATPGSSRSVPASAAEADSSEDDSSEGFDDSEDDNDMSESMEAFEGEEDEHDMLRPGTVAESRGRRYRSREAGDGSGQGPTIKKASYAGGLGHSGHTALPKGADPDRGYEDSDEDWGKEDSSTSGTGKSYKMKTSRFSRNKLQRKVAKPIVREANRRIERLGNEVSRLRESNRAKDRKIERYKGIMRFNESKRSATELLNLAVDKEILSQGAARTLRESLYGLNRREQIHEIKMAAQLLESATEGAVARLTESVDGNGARGGVVSWRTTEAEDSVLAGFAEDGIPVVDEE
jgi:hypothetical protein